MKIEDVCGLPGPKSPGVLFGAKRLLVPAVVQIDGTLVQPLGEKQEMLVRTAGDDQTAFSTTRYHQPSPDAHMEETLDIGRESCHTSFRCKVQSSAIVSKVILPGNGKKAIDGDGLRLGSTAAMPRF